MAQRAAIGGDRVRPVVNCAAPPLRRPLGFDVVGSPFAELPLDPNAYYAMGSPAPRPVDISLPAQWEWQCEERAAWISSHGC